MGGGYGNSSGDIFLAFSTANEGAYADGRGADGIARIEMLSDEWTDPYYKATAEAVELIEAYDILDRQCRAFLAEKSQDFPFLQADVAGEDDWHGQDDVPPETDNTAQPS